MRKRLKKSTKWKGRSKWSRTRIQLCRSRCSLLMEWWVSKRKTLWVRSDKMRCRLSVWRLKLSKLKSDKSILSEISKSLNKVLKKWTKLCLIGKDNMISRSESLRKNFICRFIRDKSILWKRTQKPIMSLPSWRSFTRVNWSNCKERKTMKRGISMKGLVFSKLESQKRTKI